MKCVKYINYLDLILTVHVKIEIGGCQGWGYYGFGKA